MRVAIPRWAFLHYVYEPNSPIVYVICRGLLDDRNDADDVHQDVFLALLRTESESFWSAVREAMELGEAAHPRVRAYVLQSARHAVHALRRRRSTPLRETCGLKESLPSREFTPEENLVQRELLGCLRVALERLTAKERRAIVDYYFEHQSATMIAERSGLTPRSIHMALHRGRCKLAGEGLRLFAPSQASRWRDAGQPSSRRRQLSRSRGA